MEFITSNKGSRKLCYAGHAYTKKNQSKTIVRWECTQRSARQCKGALITDLAVSNLMIITNYTYIFQKNKCLNVFTKKQTNKCLNTNLTCKIEHIWKKIQFNLTKIYNIEHWNWSHLIYHSSTIPMAVISKGDFVRRGFCPPYGGDFVHLVKITRGFMSIL